MYYVCPYKKVMFCLKTQYINGFDQIKYAFIMLEKAVILAYFIDNYIKTIEMLIECQSIYKLKK